VVTRKRRVQDIAGDRVGGSLHLGGAAAAAEPVVVDQASRSPRAGCSYAYVARHIRRRRELRWRALEIVAAEAEFEQGLGQRFRARLGPPNR
jgi:hypothetical protein